MGPVRARAADVVLATALAALLAGYNNVLASREWHRRWYVPANLAATALLLGLARCRGLSESELGLARSQARSGFRHGLVLGAAVAGGLAVAAAVPVTRPWLRDARVAGLGWPTVVYRAAVRVPVGTVLWEETAFRGVLLAALGRVLPRRVAVAASAALFGVWHIRPTLEAMHLNALAAGRGRRVIAVGGSVGGTALAGGLLTMLRLRTGSMLAPALVHLATNSGSLIAAAMADRLGVFSRTRPI